jgi:beta-glucanase (GH16 family)
VTAPASTSPSGVSVPKGDLPGWKQVMAEDFTGSTLPTGWGSYEGQPGGEPNGNWLHSHTVVGNGVMTLAGYQDAGKFTTGGVMASGASIGNLTYGKYEVRFKIAKGHGVKYAALLWPVSEHWPVDGEIDFAEDGGGDRDTSTGTIHYGADNSQIQKTATGDFSTWTTMGVEWTPSKVVYTMNGQPWATVTGSSVPHTAMNLAIQTQAGTCGSWAGATCPDSTTPAHVDMQVDWAVAYAYQP